MGLAEQIKPDDWRSVRSAIRKLNTKLGPTAKPTFAGQTIINNLGITDISSISTICTLAAGLNVLRVTGLQTDDVAMSGTLRGAYIDVSNGILAATGTIRGMELKARTEAPGDTGNDVAVLEGLSISADSKGHSVTTMRAAEFIVDGTIGGTIGEAVGLRIANNLQANKATVSYGLQIYRDSFDYTYDISLSLGGHITGDSYINQDLRIAASPTFTGLTLSGLTASRLVATDADKALVSTALVDWVTGTANRVTVSADDDPAGGIVLTGPQDIHTGASPTFAGLTVDTTTLVVDAVNHTVEPLILELVTTTTSATGVIRKGVDRFIHDFHHPTGGGEIPTGRNTFVGVNAGNFTMGSTATEVYHGSYNNAMGYASLYSNTTGYHNNAMGYASLYFNTTGNNNNAMGYASLRSNTTGNNNNAMGYASLYFNTTGNNNNAMGSSSLYSNTTGYHNNAMGRSSLLSNTTGYQNNAMGYASLSSLKPTSKAITAFADYSGTVAGTVLATSVGHGQAGTPTLQISGTVNYNASEVCTVVDEDTFYFTATWVATETGWWGIDSEARYNTAVGANSGYSLTTGSANIFLGYDAGYRQTTNDNLLIVDNQLRADAATELTNAILYGVMAAAPADQTLRINASTLVTDKIAFTQTDLNEYIDSLADGYLDFGATTGFRFNNDIYIATGKVLKVNSVQVVGARVVDARCDDALNSGDATTDGVIDALRDAMIAHGLIAAA